MSAALMRAALFSPAARWVAARLRPSWRIAIDAWRYDVDVDHSILIPMPDGVRLAASLYRPKDAGGPLPTVLVRLPYHRLRFAGGFQWALFFARCGYTVVVQDLRGTGDSGGELLPWRDAGTDGVATLDWIASQTWSTGKVGTFGCSALGETQFSLATRRHPAHCAMIPSGAGGAVGSAAGRFSYFGVFEGGIFNLASGFGWFASSGTKNPRAPRAVAFNLSEHLRTLPVSALVDKVRPAPNGYSEFLSTPLNDPRWEEWGYLSDADRVEVPSLVFNTWGDQTVGSTLALAEDWRRRDPASAARHKVVIGPGNHCGHADWREATRFGDLIVEKASRPLEKWYLRWFDHWLRGTGDALAELKAFNYFMLVENRWLASETWPPQGTYGERWYLGSAGRANSRHGDGELSREPASKAEADSFTYDPLEPVPSRGGPVCCTGDPLERSGPSDQVDVESRDDVLVYTSPPLVEDLRIVGPLKARLTMSSSAADTDVVVRLVHVWPDGRATGIQEGALRLRYRNGFESPQLMEPEQRYEVVVDMRAIAYKVPKHHRLRLQVTSSSFPRLERNLNTGAHNNADETRRVVAVNKVHYAAGAASCIELPVGSGGV